MVGREGEGHLPRGGGTGRGTYHVVVGREVEGVLCLQQPPVGRVRLRPVPVRAIVVVVLDLGDSESGSSLPAPCWPCCQAEPGMGWVSRRARSRGLWGKHSTCPRLGLRLCARGHRRTAPESGQSSLTPAPSVPGRLHIFPPFAGGEGREPQAAARAPQGLGAAQGWSQSHRCCRAGAPRARSSGGLTTQLCVCVCISVTMCVCMCVSVCQYEYV